jgi:hypothetical protein
MEIEVHTLISFLFSIQPDISESQYFAPTAINGSLDPVFYPVVKVSVIVSHVHVRMA